jgi:hypothetical protein
VPFILITLTMEAVRIRSSWIGSEMMDVGKAR